MPNSVICYRRFDTLAKPNKDECLAAPTCIIDPQDEKSFVPVFAQSQVNLLLTKPKLAAE